MNRFENDVHQHAQQRTITPTGTNGGKRTRVPLSEQTKFQPITRESVEQVSGRTGLSQQKSYHKLRHARSPKVQEQLDRVKSAVMQHARENGAR